MSDPTTDTGAKFTMAEPVVTAGASTATAIALTGALMQLAEAYDWQHFTTQQSTAIYGLVGIIVGIGSALLARDKVWPDHKVQAMVAKALATPAPVTSSGTVSVGPFATGTTLISASPSTPLSYGDQLVADAIAAQQLAGTLDYTATPEDPSRPEV